MTRPDDNFKRRVSDNGYPSWLTKTLLTGSILLVSAGIGWTVSAVSNVNDKTDRNTNRITIIETEHTEFREIIREQKENYKDIINKLNNMDKKLTQLESKF